MERLLLLRLCFLSCTFGIFLNMQAFSDASTGTTIYYNIVSPTDKTASVTNNTSSSYKGDIVIPSQVKYSGVTYTVVGIGSGAFSGCSDLISISLPETISTISSSAFYNCSGLTTLLIPESVLEIQAYAFKGCTGLKEIRIPDNVTSIKGSACEGCTNLTSAYIGKSVTTFGNYMFQGCTNLETIELNASPQEIYSTAFAGCSSVRTLIIGEDVTKINEESLTGLTGLSKIVYNAVRSSSGCTSSSSCWPNPRAIATLEIGDKVELLPPYIFRNFTSLTSVTLPASLTQISNHVFNGCSKLTQITSHALIPPSTPNSAFSNYDATLFVPNVSLTYYQSANTWKDFYSIVGYKLEGDVDGDWSVSTADIDKMISYLLGLNPEGFDEQAADVNGDGTIDMKDVVLVTNVVNEGETSSDATLTAVSLSADNIGMPVGETENLDVKLANTGNATAFSLDIPSIDGLTLGTPVLSDRAASHTLYYNTLSDGTLRIIAHSYESTAFSQSDGTLLTVPVTGNSVGDYSLAINNISVVGQEGEGLNAGNASPTVSVTEVVATSITLSKTELEMKAGTTERLTATVLPSNTTNPVITWTSSDETVAIVNNGTITALSKGSVTIIASCGSVSATCVVIVSYADVENIVVSEDEEDIFANGLTLKVGESYALSVTVSPSTADPTLTFKSDNNDIASVDEQGVVLGVSAGVTTVYISAGSVTKSVRITVESEKEQCMTPEIDLDNDWNLVVTCATEGAKVYTSIAVDDCKDVTTESGDAIPMTGIYKVTAVAKAEGYLDSDPATATVVWAKAASESTGVDAIEIGTTRPLVLRSEGSSLVILGTSTVEKISVYGLDGTLFFEGNGGDGRTEIAGPFTPGTIYVVYVGCRTVKYLF